MSSVETELEPDCRGNNSYLLLYLYRHIQQPINENAKGKEITQFYAFCRICPSQCNLMQQVLEIHKQQPAGQVVSTVSSTES